MPDAVAARPLTLADALRRATADLGNAGIEGPGNDARLLISAALGLSAAQVLARPERPLRPEEVESFGRLIARRAAREPVSRILGEREFYGRTFGISPATLDPRPDSETLIDATLELVAREGWQSRALRILDVGTGSGCLLLTLLAELPSAFGVGSDVSVAALATARSNAVRLGLARSAGWLAGDLVAAVRGPFDLLISNPPYIPSLAIAQAEPEVREHDPLVALDGGADGVAFFRRLSRVVGKIVPDGWIVLETAHNQADAVATLLAAEGLRKISVQRDVAGRRRCVAARTRN
ncbi:MAG TPA: peptide chain release factor N(5)-glutamine methyltransferase [Hyphomicrobiaceae bacterium]|nr:peptide chain release factor N(5)-glutamine methyltransferase [Hyphomicrobiaceae bacterium]